MPRNAPAQANGRGTAAAAAVMATNAIALLQQIAQGVQELVKDSNTQREHLAYGAAGMEKVLPNWPIAGESRRILPARTAGGLYQVVQQGSGSGASDLFDSDYGRGGLQIINTGSVPCYVYLAKGGDARNGGAPTLYLAANGSGTWDGKISNELWCGPVSAEGIGGTTTLTVALI